ncbi:hypothetical protein LR48_Vigan10g152500 [Vigna angularis]|uniref:Uncharacterized protein n=1 Tax=Phaseolus angularis TaxID=3914 RepID=A0A0L9VKY3_PHAAN|nr:hypothetical protein LR48_Vigan10g152500 [Vigna angularis]
MPRNLNFPCALLGKRKSHKEKSSSSQKRSKESPRSRPFLIDHFDSVIHVARKANFNLSNVDRSYFKAMTMEEAIDATFELNVQAGICMDVEYTSYWASVTHCFGGEKVRVSRFWGKRKDMKLEPLDRVNLTAYDAVALLASSIRRGRWKEIMGRKGSVRNWFHAFDTGNDTGKASAGRSGTPSKPVQVLPSVRVVSCDEVVAVEEQPLVRKRKGKMVDATGGVPKRMKETAEETDRPFPKGLWDPSFNLSHKMDFNLDDAEKKVVESMTEQQMADDLLEMASRIAMAAWHMAQRQSEQLLREGQALLNSTRAAGSALKKERDELRLAHDQMTSELAQLRKIVVAVTQERDGAIKERDELIAAAAEDREEREEMREAIMVEHTRGFKKALRQVAHLLQVSTEGVAFDVGKDVYEGQMLPLAEVPEDAFLEAEDGVEHATVATEGPNEMAAEEEPSVGAVEEAVVGSPNVVID